MDPLTFIEFFNFFRLKTSIKRNYISQTSKSDLIKKISNNLTRTDDIYIFQSNPKKFVGSFVPNSDNFIANLTYQFKKETKTIPRLIEIHGTIKSTDSNSLLKVEYKQTKQLKKNSRILLLINSILLLILILRINDLSYFLALTTFILLITILICSVTYNLIKKQIIYTEKYLIFDDQ